MGYKLYREIRDHAPLDWTPAERLVALIIADDANDDSRKAYLPVAGEWRTRRGSGEDYWQDGIAERAGLTPDAVRRVFQRLTERGFEFRVPIKTGSDGRHVFALKGHSLDFFVPPMPEGRPDASPGCTRDRSSRKGGTTVLPLTQGGTTDRKGGTLVPPLSSGPLTNLFSSRSKSNTGPAARPTHFVRGQNGHGLDHR